MFLVSITASKRVSAVGMGRMEEGGRKGGGRKREKERKKKEKEKERGEDILQGWERRETNQKNPKFELKEAYLV